LIPEYVAVEIRVGKSWCIKSRYLTILLMSSAEAGSTEQVDVWELEDDAWNMSRKYSGAA
jgi:hypothetical protein